jgi:glycosyltransferase involved in cell wall biosynthesis
VFGSNEASHNEENGSDRVRTPKKVGNANDTYSMCHHRHSKSDTKHCLLHLPTKISQKSIYQQHNINMRIALVAPLFEHVPPRNYGGTERVVYFIVEELIRLGHQVTLYATRGSETSAELIECSPSTLRELGIGTSAEDCNDPYTAQLKLAFSGTHEHDIVHVHHGTYPFHIAALAANKNIPVVWTDHNAVHNDGKPALFNSLAKYGIGLTALSDSHRRTVPGANWLDTVHHGLPAQMLTPSGKTPTYLAFLGRISPEKGITTAVRISEAGGFELKVAAKVDQVNLEFYENEVKPLFEQSNVDFIGEISEKQKGPFLSEAIALIFPISWQEPFGLVMIEAMACGCPVIAFRMGSVAEIIEDGVTGFVVDTEEEAIEALKEIEKLDRKRIRQRFEERFTSTTMAKKYVDIYERVIQQANVMKEAKELARGINLEEFEEISVVPKARVSTRERADIYDAFRDTLSPTAFARPGPSRHVSVYR